MVTHKSEHWKRLREARRKLLRYLRLRIPKSILRKRRKRRSRSRSKKAKAQKKVHQYAIGPNADFILHSNAFHKLPPIVPPNGELFIPEVFSLSKAPNESFWFLKSLFYTLYTHQGQQIKFNYSKSIEIDLAASTCMDLILSDFFRYLRNKKRLTRFDAIGMNNENIKKFLFSSGIVKHFTGHRMNLKDVRTFNLCEGIRGKNIGIKETNTTQLVDYIESCLSDVGKKLKHSTKKNLARVIGEVLINAEEHSTTNHRYAIGHFEVSENENQTIGMFQLVILNFGSTIYETLLDSDFCKKSGIIRRMSELSKQYVKRGLFTKLISPSTNNEFQFEEESLHTLYALQDAVSSISKERGNGTIQFIKSFFNLCGNRPDGISHLTLFSGNTRIIFDGTYLTKSIQKQGENFEVMTFNSTDNIEDPPEKKFVNFTPNFFPGTLIYANICLRKDNVEVL